MAFLYYIGSLVVIVIFTIIDLPWYFVISTAILMASWSIASAIRDGSHEISKSIDESIRNGIRKITKAIKDK